MNNIQILANTEGEVWVVILTVVFVWAYRDTIRQAKKKDKDNHQ